MPRTFSATMMSAMNSEEFNKYMLLLVTITHEGGSLRYARGFEDITSLGRTFVKAAFNIGFPDEGGDSPPTVTASFDAANTDLVAILREDNARPTITLEIALRSSPDTIEEGPMTFEVLRWQEKSGIMSVEIGFEPILNEAIPAERYTPTLFPGLFTSALS